MKVRDIMTTPVITVPATTRVADVVRLMLDKGLSGLPVIGPGDQMIGLITRADVVTKHATAHVPFYVGVLGGILPIETPDRDEEVRRVLAVTAQDLMSENPVTIGPDTEIETAADLMVEEGVNPIPVLENNRLVGILSDVDILRLLLVEEEGEKPIPSP